MIDIVENTNWASIGTRDVSDLQINKKMLCNSGANSNTKRNCNDNGPSGLDSHGTKNSKTGSLTFGHFLAQQI